jgi:hypothetical protein
LFYQLSNPPAATRSRESGRKRDSEREGREKQKEGEETEADTAGRNDHGGTIEAARIDDDERGSPSSPLRGKQVDPDRETQKVRRSDADASMDGWTSVVATASNR